MSMYATSSDYDKRSPPTGGGRGYRGGSSNTMRGRGDEGDSPASLPLGPSGSRLDVIADSVASSLTTPSQEERRREERRSKRASARETKRSMIGGPELRTSMGLAPGDPMPDFDDPDYSFQPPVMPGSFAVAGPGAREAQQRASVKGRSPAGAYEDNDNLVEGGGAAGDDEKTQQNLPVAFEAEVVFDYPNHDIVVAQKDEGRRTVPLLWLLIGGCIMFIAAVALSVGLGVALGGNGARSSSSNSLVVEPTFQPVEAPTFTPVVAPTFTPVVPPTFTPVVPPTYPPMDGPTHAPQPAPTFTPVVPPTFTPVVPPTFAPVAPNPSPTATDATTSEPTVLQPTSTPEPTASPTVTPVNPQVQPTQRPVAPTKSPTNAPVEAATDSPTAPAGGSSNNPVYTGSNGMPCKCRFYTQDILVSSTDDYRTLDSGELQAYINAMLASVDSFGPYPLQRRLATIRWPLRARILQPTSINYNFDLVGQSLIGTAGTNPFGVREKFSWEFCANDASYIDDYHDAFLSYMKNSGNRDPIASQVRDAGLSSLTEMKAPTETGEFCG